jgi:hypothetical protein
VTCGKKLYQLHLEFNNLFLEQEDDESDKTDSGNDINTCSRETAVQSLNESLQSVLFVNFLGGNHIAL